MVYRGFSKNHPSILEIFDKMLKKCEFHYFFTFLVFWNLTGQSSGENDMMTVVKTSKKIQ